MDTIYSVHDLHIWTTHPLCKEYFCPSRSLIRFKRKLESVQTANCRAITREIARQKGLRAGGVCCSDGPETLRNPVQIRPKAEKPTMSSNCVSSEQSAVSQALTLHQTIVIYIPMEALRIISGTINYTAFQVLTLVRNDEHSGDSPWALESF